MHDEDDRAAAFARALGAEISAWRRRGGLSREQLGELTGLSDSTIGRIEREGPKDVADTWRIADALRVPFQDLVRRAEESLLIEEEASEEEESPANGRGSAAGRKPGAVRDELERHRLRSRPHPNG